MKPFSFGKYCEEKYCHWPLLELFMYTLRHNRRKIFAAIFLSTNMTQNNACYIKPSSLGTTIIECYPNKKERTISKISVILKLFFALSSKIYV